MRALAEALAASVRSKHNAKLKIMIPLIMSAKELEFLLVDLKSEFYETLETALASQNALLAKAKRLVLWGTMFELPRACLVAKDIAPLVDFMSFGTNDLTQTTLGLSRDDSGRFIPEYLEKGLLDFDPFETLDREGVGRLIEMAVLDARKVNKKIHIGICGEHGGDPGSIPFFHNLNFHYVSCSPYRVPIARLATAHAQIDKLSAKKKKQNRKK
jgi:pyruvate,orthophosphate dikinase